MQNFKSGIYTGRLMHRRLLPRLHQFRYKVFMMYLDLDELDAVLDLSFWWSRKRWALAQFRRSDYFGSGQESLKDAVKNKVASELGFFPDGRVCMLANFRYFGYVINPLTIYYCFDAKEKLQALLLEVTNTPWREKHQYVISCDQSDSMCKAEFAKRLHVSPFQPMDMTYDWRSSIPGETISVFMKNWKDNVCVFEAELALSRKEISKMALSTVVFSYPLMTIKVLLSIYWQALRLWFKRIPFYSNPKEN